MVRIVNDIDKTIIGNQLEREPRGLREVVSRCSFNCPQVVETNPFLEGGQPFPTLYWLTCPFKVREISRLESEGWAERLQAEIEADGSLKKRLLAAQQEYRAARRLHELSPSHPVFDTGIGGVRDLAAVKCLHAHYAHFLAGGNNPIGDMVHEKIAELSCNERCDRR